MVLPDKEEIKGLSNLGAKEREAPTMAIVSTKNKKH
jgi:hypothetical protein